LQTGAVFASGDAPGARSATFAWGAAGGRLGVMIPLGGRFLLRLRGDLLGDLSPPAYKMNGQTQWTASVVEGSFGVDAVVRFP
jgi:hypothetical protein